MSVWICVTATVPLLLGAFLGAVGFCHAEYDPLSAGRWGQLIEALRFRAYGLHDITLQTVLGTISELATCTFQVDVFRRAWRESDDGRVTLVCAGLVDYWYSVYLVLFEHAAVSWDLKSLHFATASSISLVTCVLGRSEAKSRTDALVHPSFLYGRRERLVSLWMTIAVILLAVVTWLVWFFVLLGGDRFLFDLALQPAVAVACAGTPWPLIVSRRAVTLSTRYRPDPFGYIVLAGYAVAVLLSGLGVIVSTLAPITHLALSLATCVGRSHLPRFPRS
jgi:hypothetical protein